MTDLLIPPSPSEADYAAIAPDSDEALFGREEPFALFADWFAEAKVREPNDPNAMTLATVDAQGFPDARQVLLKDVNRRGFTFYSNLESAKGRQLAANPKAALLFHWKSLRRQVRIRGPVEAVSPEEADAYFATRARDSQIGAWASDQSRPMPERASLKRRMAEFGMKFSDDEHLPRPPYWSGYRVVPQRIEFWRDRPFRLHDRLSFERAGPSAEWRRERLYP
jgi:pyridoxamine 5'-phosphate oxidase